MYHSKQDSVDFPTFSGFIVLLLVSLAFSIMALLHVSQAGELSPKDVMVHNEEARKIDDVNSDASITTGGGGGAEKIKQFTWWRKLMADQVHFNTLTRFHQPAEVRGEGILFLEHEGDQNDVQIYLPAFKKIRRVESQAQSGSFMGSEFSYADIATPHVEDYKYSAQKDDVCSAANEKLRCYVIESVPVSDAVKERTGYAKTVQWVRQDNFMVARGEFYDAEGKLWKKMTASEIKEVDAAKHKWMAEQIRIENVRNARFTSLKFSGVKVNVGIPDSTFSMQNLSRDK